MAAIVTSGAGLEFDADQNEGKMAAFIQFF
jgi:hypothetical protein